MTNEDLVRFHSSQQSLAGEIAYRKTMRDAGFSEGEIDGMILKAYLRGRFYRTWGLAIVIAAIAGGAYLGLGIVGFLVLLPVTAICVGFAAIKYVSSQGEQPELWVREKGTTWTGVWRRR